MIVVCASKLETIHVWNTKARAAQKLLSAAMVKGPVGLVFNDFLDTFEVEDVEGESYKEVLLEHVDWAPIATDPTLITVRCIDEEVLRLGLGDTVELRPLPVHEEANKGEPVPTTAESVFVVERVLNTKTCRLRLVGPHDAASSVATATATAALRQRSHASSTFVLQKLKTRRTIHHQPFDQQLRAPSFAECNGCLSPKHDWALKTVLLATLQAFDTLQFATDDVDDPLRHDVTERQALGRLLLIEELKEHGVRDPWRPIKAGGRIGRQWFDYVYPRYLRSCVDAPCPATISVIGATLAQEAVKGLTQRYAPISQLWLFESLDSLDDDADADDDTGDEAATDTVLSSQEANAVSRVYGEAIQNELRGLRVFVVGAGAIGCELLKNFALLGVGEGHRDRHGHVNGTTTNATMPTDSDEDDAAELSTSLWGRHGLQRGGIVVTDMDAIERSNLNRQLLFRYV